MTTAVIRKPFYRSGGLFRPLLAFMVLFLTCRGLSLAQDCLVRL